MKELSKCLNTMRFPCLVYREDGFLLGQNQLFSMFFGDPVDVHRRSIFELITSGSEDLSVELEMTNGRVIKCIVDVCSLDFQPKCYVVLLSNMGSQKWDELALDHVETSRFVAVGQMASGIAHEINNPLTVVMSKLHLITQLNSYEYSEEIKNRIEDSVKKAQTNVVRITKIIKGLRNLARDSRSDDFEESDLNQIFNEALELNEERIKHAGIFVESDLSATALPIYSRPFQLCQVIVNLLSNAIDAIGNSNLGRIFIKTFQDHEFAYFRISDSGPGVSQSHEHLIMVPFFTTKNPGAGTGMGLSISKQIIASHAGNLKLNLNVSRSCFEFKIPLRR